MEKDFETQLAELTLTEQEIMESDPLVFFDRLDQVAALFRELAKDKRLSLGTKEWAEYTEQVKIRFGQWSHAFNKVLRARIKETDQIKTIPKMIETKRLNFVHLYWSKIKNFIFLMNDSNLFFKGGELSALREAMREIRFAAGNTKESDYPSQEHINGN